MTAYIHTVSRKQSPINVGYSQLPAATHLHQSRRLLAVSSVPPDQKSISVHFWPNKGRHNFRFVASCSGFSSTSERSRHPAVLRRALLFPPPPHFFHFSSSSLRLIGRTGQRHDFRPGRLPKPGQFVPFLSLPLCPQTRSSAPSATLNPALVFL